MACLTALGPFQCGLAAPQPLMAANDPLDSAFSGSLRRGLSEELRELADFGLGGEETQQPQPMTLEVST